MTGQLGSSTRSARFEAIAGQTHVVIAMVEADGRLSYLNPAGRMLLGHPVDPAGADLTGALLAEHLHDGADPLAATPLREATEHGVWSGESDVVDASGVPVPVSLVVTAHRGRSGELEFFSLVARDARARRRAQRALHAERERYRILVAQAPVGIFVTDVTGATVFANEHAGEMVGRPAAELRGFAWNDHVHPDDREAVRAGYLAAIAEGREWTQEYRLVSAGGGQRLVSSSARPLRDPDGTPTGYLGVTVDVTAQRLAEQQRRRAAAEDAAREVADAAAARIRSLVDGLAAVVWEADADGLGFTFVSDRAEQVLGYPRSQWLEEGFWPGVVHPDDRDEVTACRARSTAAARDFDLTYRAVAADGRVLWLHDVVHVVRDADGVARRLQGVMIDVTQRKRAERFAAVLAESSRLLAGPEDARFRLAALAQLVRDVFGDFVVVSVRDPDGRFRRVAAAHPDPETERLLADLPPIRVPPDRAEQFRRGDPVVIPLDGEMAARIADDEHDVHALISLLASQTLVVPLVSAGRLLGAITFFTGGESRAYDDADLTLAEELGRRAAAMVAAEAARRRERHIQQVTADLASSDGVVEAAGRLTERMVEILGAGAAAFYLAEPDRTLRLNHHVGYSAKLMKAFATIPGGARVPVADAFRTGEAVWVGSREEWEQHYPSIIPLARGNGMVASAAVPLFAGGRALGAIALSFPDARDFAPDEREFVLALAAQVAPAFERAALADERRHVAETLQRSLLPKGLPTIEGLGFAARYLPGVAGVAAGGDWYDVLPLDGDRVAVAVGDVVGQGAAAAAVMGQLRSALAAYLLEGHAPHAALDRLHRFAGTLDGATGSTAICVVVNPHTGELEWARAGHPPPLLLTADGARYLPEIPGAVLGMRDRPPSAAGRAALGPGSTVLLYTDGLVERRGQVIDEGLGRLARVAAALRAEPAEVLATRLLDRCLAPNGPADDVALIVTRVVPVPLRLRLPAEAARLRELRRAVGGWAEAADLPDELTYDLQLAIGEAAANVVEHAYRDRAHGPLEVELWYDAGPAVHARVRDVGVWRPRRADPGYRGRGLDLIQAVAQEAVVEPGPDGTEVRFRISVPGDA